MLRHFVFLYWKESVIFKNITVMDLMLSAQAFNFCACHFMRPILKSRAQHAGGALAHCCAPPNTPNTCDNHRRHVALACRLLVEELRKWSVHVSDPRSILSLDPERYLAGLGHLTLSALSTGTMHFKPNGGLASMNPHHILESVFSTNMANVLIFT